MSINWVMLSEPDGFVNLPGEQRLWTSPPRTSIHLDSLNKNPNHEPFAMTRADGRIFLTSRRIVYIPTAQSKPPPPSTSSSSSALSVLQSFACPITHVHDTRVTAPWFGPNEVVSLIQPVPNGGIPPHHPAIKLTLTFRDGGAYDFHTKFVQVKERLQQALEVRGMAGLGTDGGSAGQAEALAAASADVTLEDLPAYQETDAGRNAQEPMIAPTARRVTRQQQEEPLLELGSTAREVPADPPLSVPADAPPGYEEAQSSGVSRASERQQDGKLALDRKE